MTFCQPGRIIRLTGAVSVYDYRRNQLGRSPFSSSSMRGGQLAGKAPHVIRRNQEL